MCVCVYFIHLLWAQGFTRCTSMPFSLIFSLTCSFLLVCVCVCAHVRVYLCICAFNITFTVPTVPFLVAKHRLFNQSNTHQTDSLTPLAFLWFFLLNIFYLFAYSRLPFPLSLLQPYSQIANSEWHRKNSLFWPRRTLIFHPLYSSHKLHTVQNVLYFILFHVFLSFLLS